MILHRTTAIPIPIIHFPFPSITTTQFLKTSVQIKIIKFKTKILSNNPKTKIKLKITIKITTKSTKQLKTRTIQTLVYHSTTTNPRVPLSTTTGLNCTPTKTPTSAS